MRTGLLAVVVALLCAAPALAGSSPAPDSATTWRASASWLAQARCIHLKEGPWAANTGNGYFGGMQFSAVTWKRVGGKIDPAFTHAGSTAYPFTAAPQEQLYRAWLLWRQDGHSWRSWGAVGAACSQ